MKAVKNLMLCSLFVVLGTFVLFGCSKKVDTTKPITEVKAEADKMTVDQLKTTAMTYKDAIVAKQADVEKIVAKLKEVPITKLDEVKNLKKEIDDLNAAIKPIKERFDVYYEMLKAKGSDVSSLKL